MEKVRLTLLIFLSILSLIFSACGSPSQNGNEENGLAAKAVESYLIALVEKDADLIASLSCSAWEQNARTEVDSFQAVSIRLENLQCLEITKKEEGTSLVTCQGKLLATYNEEDQDLDLSSRIYEVTQEGGEYLVCGYR